MNLKWINGLELENNDDVNRYFFTYKNWVWNGLEDEYINRKGILDKYQFSILTTWDNNVGEQYIFSLDKKSFA